MMAEISSKLLVKSLFRQKEIPKTPFIPWIGTFAAKLEQIPVEDMFSDPGLLSTALLNCQELFGYDAITIAYDTSLEAEACGCEIEWPEDQATLPQVVSHPFSGGTDIGKIDIQNLEKRGRIPVYIEAIKRINIMRGKQVAILGMVTGPFTLAQRLFGEGLEEALKQNKDEALRTVAAAGGVSLKLCRTYCELGVDVVVINDEILGKIDASLYSAVAGSLKSIWNVIRFYDARSLILTSGVIPEKAGPIINLQADGVSLGADMNDTVLREYEPGRKVCLGISIPTRVLNMPAGTINLADVPSTENRQGCFITTDGEIPYNTSVETVQELIKTIYPD